MKAESLTGILVGQRLAVILWLAAVIPASIIAASQSNLHGGWDIAVSLLMLVPFGCLEKLCSIMNLIAIERDWVSHDTGELGKRQPK